MRREKLRSTNVRYIRFPPYVNMESAPVLGRWRRFLARFKRWPR